jgi:1,4-alpha-glucan branching enzyme
MVDFHKHLTRFRVFNRDADQMYVVGDFNHWSTIAMPMHEMGDGLWELSVALPPGEYRFRYRSDRDRWLTDYAAFGIEHDRLRGWNSVVRVPRLTRPRSVVRTA